MTTRHWWAGIAEVPLVWDTILVDGLGPTLQLATKWPRERQSREVSEKPNQGSPSEASTKNNAVVRREIGVPIAEQIYFRRDSNLGWTQQYWWFSFQTQQIVCQKFWVNWFPDDRFHWKSLKRLLPTFLKRRRDCARVRVPIGLVIYVLVGIFFADSEGYRGESRPQGRRQVFKMAEGKWRGKTWTWRILKKGDRKSVAPVVHPTRPASHAEAPESVTLWEILTSEVQSRNSFFSSQIRCCGTF